MSSSLKFVDGTPVSPAATEYHDAPQIAVQDPTPQYEKSHHPTFPVPQHQAVGSTTTNNNGYGSKAHSRAASVVSSNSKRVSIAADDVVLGRGSGADVKRSGTWARGPGTSGLHETEDQEGGATGVGRKLSLAERAMDAGQRIPEERNAALTKAEKKDAKRLSKIIVAEGKAEDKQLKSGLKELASLQAAQKKASATETAATHAQSKAAREEQRASQAYLEAKTRHERATANLTVCLERLTLAREQAQKMTTLVRAQAEDVDRMRERKATDDREREVKLANLKAGLLSP